MPHRPPRPPHPEHKKFFRRMRSSVDETIERLGAVRFREDPIVGRKYSRATSIISSAYKRHNAILQQAFIERLKDCARLRVWTEDGFKPFFNILVFDKEYRSLNAYSVKRGNGSYDTNKCKVFRKERARIKKRLRSYCDRNLGIIPETSNAHMIFYYGVLSLEPPFAISGDNLDKHFRFPVHEAIECVNAYFADRLFEFIEQEG